MKLRFFSLVTLFSGLVLSAVGVLLPFILLQKQISQEGAIGIIGGAGKDTFLLVLRYFEWLICVILFGAALVVTGLFSLIFNKTVKSNCGIKTSAISLGISFVGASGLVCAFSAYVIAAFNEESKHPVEYPVFMIGGILSLLLFVALIAVYFKFRRVKWSVSGFVIDIFTSIIYLPAFFFVISYLCDKIS